ncbi:MAG TPA: hypothetical protein VE753_01855 [Gaiellaceae bacterium]|nr:hypothetical protein [Gaiellaceae bacterium]
MDGSAVRQRLLDVLIDRVREETYPSVTMMNRIEAGLRTREQLEDYATVLIQKVESTRFPSLAMLDRVDAVAARLE